jgi:hypothetical protein
MEQAAMNWPTFGLVLAGEFIFALALAAVTRLIATHKLAGQAFWLVVVGVAGVIVIAGALVGWANVLTLGACFSVAAVPMGGEYFWRVIAEHKAAAQAREELVK